MTQVPSPTGTQAHPVLAGFHAPVRDWFARSFAGPTRAQELGWPLIRSGRSTLILAPTGSGKTLTAFLAAIDRVMFEPPPPREQRCRILYVSPLKALAVDVEKNLRAPLAGVASAAEGMGHAFHQPTVAIRTGDTPGKERRQFNRGPADILITTPESLYLMLTSAARETLRCVRWVIVDEIHTMVSTKRGAHLALSLERLEELTDSPLQRIGLSATVQPVDEAARFLGGTDDDGPPTTDHRPSTTDHRPPTTEAGRSISETGASISEQPSPTTGPSHCPSSVVGRPSSVVRRPSREVAVVNAGASKQFDLKVEVPVEDMAKLAEVQETSSGAATAGTSIWPAIHPLILELIRAHRSTLIFVNSRRLAERMASALNESAGEELVRAHHGSLAREQRLQIEEELKAGRLPALVATSTLELGIDMGAIDLVVQVEAPPSVASAMQRIGRAGHQIGAPSEGVILPKFRGDLLACAALTERMRSGAVEPMHYPRNPLDVLAQQIVAMVAMDEWEVEALERVVRRAAPFAELPHSQLHGVLDMLSGRYPSADFAGLRPRVTWDRNAGTLRAREGARRIAVTNGGTIPDRGLYGVFMANAERGPMRVGELDEEMVFESRVGETFLLGASSWRIEEITHDRVLVAPAPGVPGKMPFWHGDTASRPLEFGRAIGALCRKLRALPHPEAMRLLQAEHDLDEAAARNLLQYLADQHEATGAVPDDRTLVVERYLDDMGDWRVCLLCPFGGKVLGPWAMAIGALIHRRSEMEIDLLWADDGIVARFPEADQPPPIELLIPDADEVEELVIRQLGEGGGARQSGGGAPVTAMFASRFREAAARALLLPRRHPGKRAPLWQQRKRAADLLQATAKYDTFPITLETYRECLRDVFDMGALTELLRDIQRRAVHVVTVNTQVPSPFAASLLFNYVANFMYEGDAPSAERRAQALTVDTTQLRELMGDVELRELLDAGALAQIELQLQHLTPERAARHPDALHDLFLRLGDLTREEVAARVVASTTDDRRPTTDEFSTPDAQRLTPNAQRPAEEEWLGQLEREGRVVRLTVAGEVRYVAAEDVGRYRDALGTAPPTGVPEAFLEPVRDPWGDLVARYARTHGPFQAEQLSARCGVGVALVTTALQALERAGRLVQGEFRPGGSGREWCDREVLRALRQRSLARLRHEVEPVEQPALGRLYVAWQGIGSARRGPEALLEVIEQLQGAAFPASVLETQLLPDRLAKYEPRELDALTASGGVIWVGCEPLGQRDGRISLYLAERAALLLSRRTDGPNGPIHQKLREHLAGRGASFFQQLQQAVGGGFYQEVLEALWDLVWAGEVTNDTLQPLRAFLDPRRGRTRTRGGPGSFRHRALAPREGAGRWSLVSSLVFTTPSATECLAARTRQMLDRHGVLTREAVQAEGIEGGFSSIYGVLKAMEEAGRVRRGYFVAGRGATQFALPGAVDRLRAPRAPTVEPQTILLAATDPANPYGAALPWPERADGRRPARMAGASVVLIDGALAAFMGRGERNLLTFLDQVPECEPAAVAVAVAHALAGQVRPGRTRALFVKEVDGRPATVTPMAAALKEAGFAYGPHGFMKRL
jgi:ATP-dependent helicase Lhr and Lhr-like helicase